MQLVRPARACLALTLVLSLGAADFGDARNLSAAQTGTHFPSFPYRDVSEWSVRREALRKQILVSAGLWPLRPRNPVAVSYSRAIERETFRADTVAFETLPGLLVYGNLYTPKPARQNRPAVLVPHGHWKHGRIHHEPDYSVPALCGNLARQGFVVFAWDMLGYNDTVQLPHEFGGSPFEQLWSFTSLGIQLWNGIRAVDFVSGLPNADTGRIAVTGASGGGTQTILLAAVDDRISVSAPVDMVSASFQGDDSCEMAPGLRVGTNNVEISAMVAPKPLLLVSSTKDWTKRTPMVELPMAEAVFRLHGDAAPIGNAHIDSKHNYNRQSREAVYRFFNRYLRADPQPGTTLVERALVDFDPRLLLASGARNHGGSRYREIFAAWRESSERAAARMPIEELRNLIAAQIGAEWPDQVSVIEAGPGFVLQRYGSGDRVPARWFPPQDGSTAIVVDSRGMDQALAGKKSLHGKLFIDPFQTGSAVVTHPPRRKDHLTFHRSDDSNRVQDILTAIAFVSAAHPVSIQLECDARAAAWCLAAAAISPVPVLLRDGPIPGPGTDLAKALFIPGIERAGGLASLRRLAMRPPELSKAIATE